MKVLIAGDFAPRARLAKQIEEKRYEEVFLENLRELIGAADFSFVNFESPVIEAGYKPIAKYGPNLRCTPEAVEAVKFAGFTGVTMANNHILDYGTDGLKKTVECCNALGFDVIGVGDNLQDAEKVLYLEKEGKTLAVINCCEHEFSIATDTSAGANPLNPIRQFYAIREAKKNADYVLVIVHGGHEHYPLPSPRMVETYRFFVDAGADAVVNHHQHCYSGYETYNDRPIFYGLGNFCFDIAPTRINETWNYGYLVELTFGESVECRLYPYNQYGVKPTIELLDEAAFDSELGEINALIAAGGQRLGSRIEAYYKNCAKHECWCLEPYTGNILGKLFDLGVLPRFIKGRKAAFILNHVDCESHRDKLLYALKKKNE